MRVMSMRRGKAVALLAGAMVPLLLLAGVLLPTSLEETEAGWVDPTEISATVGAGTIPAPTLTGPCSFRPGLLGLGARVRIDWALPAGYTLDDVVVEASTSGLGSVLAPLTGFNLKGNTESRGGGTYRTEVPANLLGGLLGLGSELELAILVEDSGWRSEPASVASNAGLLAGIGGTCRNLTA